MRALLTGIAALALFAMQADAMGPATDWSGVYKRRFQNGNVEGDKYASEDIMEIVRLDDTRAYVRLALEFYNGHSCSFAEVFDVEGDSLVHHGKIDEAVGKPCVLAVVHEPGKDGGKLKLEDRGEVCQAAWCGARGSFMGESWPVSARRDIRYMDKLKAAREYKDALAAAGIKPGQ